MTRILCPTDFSEPSEAAVREAQRLAAALGGELVLLHVTSDGPLWNETLYTPALRDVFEAQRQWAATALGTRAETLAAAGVPTRVLVESGVAWEAILRVAREQQADMIVMGTHGRTGLNRLLLGSVTERVLRQAPCPVLTVGPGDARRNRAA